MDSKNQDDKSGVLKFLLSLILLVITVTMFVNNGDYNIRLKDNKYLTLKGSCYGYKSDDINSAINVFSNNIYDDIKLDNNDVENIVLLSNKENNTNNFFRTFDIKVNGFAITVDDDIFGYVETKEDMNIILKDICEAYINELGIESESEFIPQIQVTGKIKATQETVKLSQLNDKDEIAEEIYKCAVVNDNILGLELRAKCTSEQDVEPSTVIDYDDELYMGQSIRIEGESGSKLVYKELTYNGLEKIDERVINEETIIEAKPTVIRKGSKNPYYDGIAFLSRPTSGGYLSSAYGEERWNSYHKGIDIAKNLGEDVTSAFDGKVIFAGYNDGGYGNLVIIEHANNIKTYYAHLNEILVQTGDDVELDERIGTIGSTGYSTGPHLHFEMRVNDEPVNPLNYIKA